VNKDKPYKRMLERLQTIEGETKRKSFLFLYKKEINIISLDKGLTGSECFETNFETSSKYSYSGTTDSSSNIYDYNLIVTEKNRGKYLTHSEDSEDISSEKEYDVKSTFSDKILYESNTDSHEPKTILKKSKSLIFQKSTKGDLLKNKNQRSENKEISIGSIGVEIGPKKLANSGKKEFKKKSAQLKTSRKLKNKSNLLQKRKRRSLKNYDFIGDGTFRKILNVSAY